MGKKYEVKAEKQCAAAALLSVTVPGLSRAKADILIKSGEVRVNGVRIKKNEQLSIGDTVTAFVPDSFNRELGIVTVYEDDNIAVFDKPSHLAYDNIPLATGRSLIPVHRLDTNTTGVILFAKTAIAAETLIDAFKTRKTSKRYEAIVSPPPKADSGQLTAYTLLDNGVARVFDRPAPGLKTMLTDYTVTERAGEVALLSVTIHTGRTHQIRAHLAHIGCPIVGDDKYGGRRAKGIDGQLLRAVSISFTGLAGELGYLNGKTFGVPSALDLATVTLLSPK